MRPMPVPSNISAQLSKIDEQMITLLDERVNLCQKALEEDENAFNAATQAEMITAWEEAADEHGLNMAVMNHLCKLVMKLCQASGE